MNSCSKSGCYLALNFIVLDIIFLESHLTVVIYGAVSVKYGMVAYNIIQALLCHGV